MSVVGTYLTTSPFSKATLPRRTSAVTSVLEPTPLLANRRSRRNMASFLAAPSFLEGFFFFLVVFSSLLLLLMRAVVVVVTCCGRAGWRKRDCRVVVGKAVARKPAAPILVPGLVVVACDE